MPRSSWAWLSLASRLSTLEMVSINWGEQDLTCCGRGRSGETEKKISSQETSRYAKIGVLGTYMYVPNMNVVRGIEGKEREREREREGGREGRGREQTCFPFTIAPG